MPLVFDPAIRQSTVAPRSRRVRRSPPRLTQYAAAATQRNVQRLATLINDLLDMEKLVAGKK